MTHICLGSGNGSGNGLSSGLRQAIIWTSASMLLIGPLGTNFNEILIGIQKFSFKKMPLKMSSEKWRPFCLNLNVLTHCGLVMPYGISELHHHQTGLLPVWGQVITSTNTNFFSIEPPEYISMKFYTKFKHFQSSKFVWKNCLQNGDHFFQASVWQLTWAWFSIKISCYQYRKSHCGDNTILRPSYLHNGFSYTGKTISLYWISTLKSFFR